MYTYVQQGIEQKGTPTYIHMPTLKLFLLTREQSPQQVEYSTDSIRRVQYSTAVVQSCSSIELQRVSIWEVGRYSSRVQLRVRVGVGKPRGGSVFFLFREWRPSCRHRQYRSTPVHRFAAAEFTVYQSHQQTSVRRLALYSCPSLGRHQASGSNSTVQSWSPLHQTTPVYQTRVNSPDRHCASEPGHRIDKLERLFATSTLRTVLYGLPTIPVLAPNFGFQLHGTARRPCGPPLVQLLIRTQLSHFQLL